MLAKLFFASLLCQIKVELACSLKFAKEDIRSSPPECVALDPNISSQGNTKFCRYQAELYPSSYWRHVTGEGCYAYTAPSKLNFRFPRATCVAYENWKAYAIKYTGFNGTAIFYDYTNDNYTSLIFQSFTTPAYADDWMKCAKAAEECCDQHMDKTNVYPNTEFSCPAIWDAWSCFSPAKNGTVSSLPCPVEHTSSSDATPCVLYSEKECFENGTWNQKTDYSTCATAPVYRRRHSFHIVTMYISIALCLPAVLIFVSYRKLRVIRVILHRNLLIACITRSVLIIVQKEMVILDALKPANVSNNVMEENGTACKILAFANNVGTNLIYACMLMDGYYLHKMIVRLFSADPNIYKLYGITAVLSVVPSIVWAAVVPNEYCWVVDSSWYQWITDAYRIGILIANFTLLLDILRTLLLKLKKNTNSQHTKSTVRAMFCLMPIFGVPLLLTANPNIIDSNSCTAGDIFYYISYILQALQGIVVAVLFCYLNNEVKNLVKDTFKRLKGHLQDACGGKTKENFPRNTDMTIVNNQADNIPVENSHVKDQVENWLGHVKIPEMSREKL